MVMGLFSRVSTAGRCRDAGRAAGSTAAGDLRVQGAHLLPEDGADPQPQEGAVDATSNAGECEGARDGHGNASFIPGAGDIHAHLQVRHACARSHIHAWAHMHRCVHARHPYARAHTRIHDRARVNGCIYVHRHACALRQPHAPCHPRAPASTHAHRHTLTFRLVHTWTGASTHAATRASMHMRSFIHAHEHTLTLMHTHSWTGAYPGRHPCTHSRACPLLYPCVPSTHVRASTHARVHTSTQNTR